MTTEAPPPTQNAGDQTILRAVYPCARGRLSLRGGSAGLDWFNNRAPDHVDGDVSTFLLNAPHFDPVQVKLVREDGAWMVGRNAVIGRGDVVVLRPAFDHLNGELSGQRWIELPWGGALCFRVRIPPQLHRKLVLTAAEEGVSLNRLASAKLAA